MDDQRSQTFAEHLIELADGDPLMTEALLSAAGERDTTRAYPVPLGPADDEDDYNCGVPGCCP